jgi:hypothetical protein
MVRVKSGKDGIRHKRLIGVVAIVIAAYVVSYFVWTRTAAYFGEKEGNPGYFFVEPSSNLREQLNAGVIRLYSPLVWFEQVLGTGRSPSYPPIGGIKKRVNVDEY